MTERTDRPSYYGDITTAIPTGPVEAEHRPYLHSEDFPEAVAAAFAGVTLGAYDRLIIAWMIRSWDGPTMATVLSLVHRTRRAAVAG